MHVTFFSKVYTFNVKKMLACRVLALVFPVDCITGILYHLTFSLSEMALQCMVEGSPGEQRSSGFKAVSCVLV